jgi:hypothetical protein
MFDESISTLTLSINEDLVFSTSVNTVVLSVIEFHSIRTVTSVGRRVQETVSGAGHTFLVIKMFNKAIHASARSQDKDFVLSTSNRLIGINRLLGFNLDWSRFNIRIFHRSRFNIRIFHRNRLNIRSLNGSGFSVRSLNGSRFNIRIFHRNRLNIRSLNGSGFSVRSLNGSRFNIRIFHRNRFDIRSLDGGRFSVRSLLDDGDIRVNRFDVQILIAFLRDDWKTRIHRFDLREVIIASRSGSFYLFGFTDKVGSIELKLRLALAGFVLAIKEGVIWASLTFISMKDVTKFAVTSTIDELLMLSGARV